MSRREADPDFNVPIRVLHVVHNLEQGGVQAWLLNLLEVGGDRWTFDFVVNSSQSHALDESFRKHGCRIFDCSPASRPLSYLKRLREVIDQHGPYDAMHSHFDPVAVPLQAAKSQGIPVRIAHSHNATQQLNAYPGFLRLLAIPFLRGLISTTATHKVAASRVAGESMFGKSATFDVHYCGIHLQRFADLSPPREKASEVLHVLHVGRFAEQKNHKFLIEVFCEILRLRPSSRLTLIGDGPLRKPIEQMVESRGIQSSVHFAGIRKDVPEVMAKSDLILMPSYYEGLPVTLMEAQAAKIRCVLSDTISRETQVIPDVFRWVSLKDSPARWAEICLAFAESDVSFHPVGLQGGPFDIQVSADRWHRLYQGTPNVL